MKMNKIALDERRVAAELGFDETGEFQESRYVGKYLENNPLIKAEGCFYSLSRQKQIWEKTEEDEVRMVAYKMFPTEGKYIWRKRYENNYLQAIKMLAYRVDKVNPYPHRINFKDSVYDFKEHEHKPRERKDYFTYEMDYSILEDVKDTPIFDKFITDITCSNKSLETYLMVVLAYLISGDKKLQKFFILRGSGANGKSTLINLLIKLLGNRFVTSISLGKINDRFTLSKAVGKKLIVASENESVIGVSTETIKKLTGDDLVEIEQKYKDGYSAKLSVETLFALNNTIKFSENSYGLKRRLEVIPFDFRVSEEDMDIDLERKLEEEIPSIMAKLIDVHKKFAEGGYRLPKCEEVEKAKKEFLDEGFRNSLGTGIFDFLEENIVLDSNSRVSKNDVYTAYSNNGSYTSTKFWMDFDKWVKYRGYKIDEVNSNGRQKVGIRLASNKREDLKGLLG
jgi:P4 family phage/plasmid primase-like protien